jgi:tetratricopeptide (TPR) repeat protein
LPLGFLLPIFKPEKRRELLFLLGPAVIYFALALTSSFTTGVRHILPVYPLFIVAAAAGAVWLCRRVKVFRYVLVVLLVYNAAAAVRSAPLYLAFANDLWGGYENTYRIFSDSNIETGQSLKLVNEYIQSENVTDCWIVTFVHPELLSAAQPCRVLPSNLRIMLSRYPMDPIPPVAEGTFFISVVEMPPRGADEYLPITNSEPVTVIGGNIFVYRGRFEIPLVAAMSHVHRSGAFLRMNSIDEAIAEARTALRLGENDPRTHLALGLALSKKGDVDEARSHLETAAALAKPDPRYRLNEVRALQELEKLSK